jgi:hypothetical protein
MGGITSEAVITFSFVQQQISVSDSGCNKYNAVRCPYEIAEMSGMTLEKEKAAHVQPGSHSECAVTSDSKETTTNPSNRSAKNYLALLEYLVKKQPISINPDSKKIR